MTNVLEGVGSLPYDEEVSNEVGKMSQTNMCWCGIDVTYAIFMQQMTWRHQEKFYRVIHHMLIPQWFPCYRGFKSSGRGYHGRWHQYYEPSVKVVEKSNRTGDLRTNPVCNLR